MIEKYLNNKVITKYPIIIINYENVRDENMAAKRIGVLTGGGDCPGLNNVIKQIVRESTDRGYEVEGLTEGWRGPIMASLGEYDVEVVTLPLDLVGVRRINREGGTILMSSRDTPFNYSGNDVSDKVIEFLNNRYYAVITIGGEDTNGAAGKLAQRGLRVVGVPKTVDKDVCETDMTLGFDSALDYVTSELERIRYTAGSHGMVYFVEIMGRNAGHLAYWSAAASNTHFLTIPEVEVDMDLLFEAIVRRKDSLPMERGYTRDGRRYAIVAVAEGTRLKGIGEIRKGREDPSGNIYLGGIADYLSQNFNDRTDYDSRSLVLGHLQRSGPPTTDDRLLGIFFGTKAVELVENESFRRMVSLRGTDVTDVSLDVVIDRMRVLDAERCYDAANFKPTPKGSLYQEIELGKPKKDIDKPK